MNKPTPQLNMKRLPKHLKAMEPETLQRLMTGFNRFRFGFAKTGEVFRDRIIPSAGIRFVGNYAKQADAEEIAALNGGSVRPYLNGRLPTGWAVWMRVAA